MEENEKNKPPHCYPNLTDQELKTLAVDIHNRKVFTDLHLREDHKMIGSVFMPVGLGAFEEWTKEDIMTIGLVYEYLDKAGPMSVNGYPTFYSMKIISSEQMEKVWEFHDLYKEKMKEFHGTETEDQHEQ